MANFTTHIAVGTVVCGALSTLTLAADVVAPENLVAVTLAGVLGSILPDIDLRDSRPARMMWSGLAIFFSFAVLFFYATEYSIAELWIIWLGTLVFVRYGLQAIFDRIAVHRGIWHSILAAGFMAVLTAIAYYHIFRRPDGVAWLAAAFMFIGYLVHLALDEIYSVDIGDRRVKASFGSAMKLYDGSRPGHSFAMLAAVALLFAVSPPTQTFVDGVSSRELWAGLQHRLLPADKWFGVIGDMGSLATADMPASPPTAAGAAAPVTGDPIETGAIGKSP